MSSPEVVAQIIAATTPAEAKAAAKAVDQDDILASIQAITGAGRVPFYQSKKFWATMAGVLLPTIAQVVTGAVTWPVAIGGGIAAIVAYVVAQAGVDKTTAAAITEASSQIITAKINKTK